MPCVLLTNASGRRVLGSGLLGLRVGLASYDPGGGRLWATSGVRLSPLPAAVSQQRLHSRTGDVHTMNHTYQVPIN